MRLQPARAFKGTLGKFYVHDNTDASFAYIGWRGGLFADWKKLYSLQ